MTKIVPKLSLNKHPRDCTDYSLVNANNVIFDNDNTVITNEFDLESNRFTIEKYYGENSNNTIVGSIACSTEVVLFISNGNIIRVYDKPTYANKPNRPGARPPMPIYYKQIVDDFDYHGGQIKGAYTYNVNGHLIISFSEYDNNNKILVPLKVINLDNVDDDNRKYPICPEVRIPTVADVTLNYTNWYKGIDYLFIRFKINANDYTQWFGLNKTVYCDKFSREIFIDTDKGGLIIGDDSNNIINKLKITKGVLVSDKYEIANCGYRINLTNINNESTPNYAYYQIGIISCTRDDTKAFRTNDIPSNILTYDINGNTVEKYATNDLITSYYNYYNVRNIVNYKNKLYISNYNEKSDNNIIANPIIKLHKNKINIDTDINKIIYYTYYHGDNKHINLTDYIPELDKTYHYDVLNNIFSTAIPIMWLTAQDRTHINRFIPTMNKRPSYEVGDKYIACANCIIDGYAKYTLVAKLRNMFYLPNDVGIYSKGMYCIVFKDDTPELYDTVDSDVRSATNNIYIKEITSTYKLIGFKSNNIDRIKITYTSIDNKKEYIDIRWHEDRAWSIRYNECIYPVNVVNKTNTNELNITNDNISYSFNLMNHRSLIPGGFYKFYIHYIDKYGKITNGYPINEIVNINNELTTQEVTIKETIPNGLYTTITVYKDVNQIIKFTFYFNINTTVKYLVDMLENIAYNETVNEQYVIPINMTAINNVTNETTNTNNITNDYVGQHFIKLYVKNLGDKINQLKSAGDETIKNYFNADGEDTYNRRDNFNIELELSNEEITVEFKKDIVVKGGEESIETIDNNLGETIYKIPEIKDNILKEYADVNELRSYDTYTISADVKELPEDYIGWFISYTQYESLSDISGYCKVDSDNKIINLYCSLFDTNDEIKFNFDRLRNINGKDYKIVDYHLYPANSTNNIGYSTRLEIKLNDTDINDFVDGIYYLYNSHEETLYNTTNKKLIPCTSIVYNTGEYLFNGNNGYTGDYNGCLSKIESIIYNKSTILNPITLGLLNIDGTTKDITPDTNLINVYEHYVYSTTFNQIKRFNNPPKKYMQVINPADEQDKWKYNAITYVEPVDTVDLFKQWYNPIDEQYPKLFLNYRIEDLNIDRFDKTIRSSNVIADETAEINWRKFNTEDYKNLTYNKGNITNLVGIGDKFYVHTEHSLFVLDVNNYLANGNKNVQLEDKQPFEVNFKEIFTTNVGFGGLQDDRAFIIGKFGYIWFDNDSNRFMTIDGNNEFGYIDNNIFKWFEGKSITNVRFGEDIRYNRLFIKFINEEVYNVLTYNYIVKEFISAYGNNNAIKFDSFINSKNKLYFINDDKNNIYNLNYNSCCEYTPKFAVIINTKFELIKYLEFITYKLHVARSSQVSIYNYSPVEGREVLYSGNYLSIFNEFVNTNKIDITTNEDAKEGSNLNAIMDYEKPRFDLGNWNLNFIFDNSHDSNIITADKHSRLYGNYFIIEFELATDRRWEFEELNVQLTNKRI